MRALLFDFDGVLVKTMEDHFQGWRRALLEYGIEMNPEELYMLEGQGVDAVASQLARKYNLPYEEKPKIVKKKLEYYDQIKKIEFYPNLLDVLHWAQEKELQMAVVTGGNRKRVYEALEGYGLLSFFPVIVTSEDVTHTKPDPEPYLMAAELLDIRPQDCVVIENAPLGIHSGLAAGCRVLAITTTLNSQHLREADVVVNSFTEMLESLKRLY